MAARAERTNAVSVTLAWDASPSTNVTGYNVYWGTATRTYSQMQGAGTNLMLTLTNKLTPGTRYYFAATAYDGFGLESDFSEECTYAPPLGPQKIPGFSLVSVQIQSSSNLTNWNAVLNIPTMYVGTTNGTKFYRSFIAIEP